MAHAAREGADILGRLDTERPWHPFVFDAEGRRFVGDFEGMYRAGVEGQFDPWFQSDPRRLDSRICLTLLEQVTYRSAVDLGCGTGSFTVNLKRADGHVTGVDVSETAIEQARARVPDIEWVCTGALEHLRGAGPVDLVLAREMLTYVEEWRDIVAAAAAVTTYIYVDQYVPAGTLGFVRSHAELEEELSRHFELLEIVSLPQRDIMAFLGRSKQR